MVPFGEIVIKPSDIKHVMELIWTLLEKKVPPPKCQKDERRGTRVRLMTPVIVGCFSLYMYRMRIHLYLVEI